MLKREIKEVIEKEENLSHLGDAWVYDNAKVLDNAIVNSINNCHGN